MQRLDKKDIKKDLVQFFELVKNERQHSQYIFLSERFMNIYKCLLQEYPEISLSNFCLSGEENIVNPKVRKIYLNDINYEFPKKIKPRDEVIIYKFCFNFAHMLIFGIEIPTITEDDKRSLLNKKNFLIHGKKVEKHTKFRNKVTYTDILDLLGLELKLLGEKGFNNSTALLPECLQNYFNFVIQNQEPLNFYLTILYNRVNYWCDVYDLDRQTVGNIVVNDMIKIFGLEKCNPILTFISEHEFGHHGYAPMLHYPLNQETDITEKYNPNIEIRKIKRLENINLCDGVIKNKSQNNMFNK